MNTEKDSQKPDVARSNVDLMLDWVKEICPNQNYVEYVKSYCHDRENVVLSVFTRNFEYEFNMHPFGGNGPMWLHSIARARKTIAGDVHPQEFKLVDGPFNYDTWCFIKHKILQFEVVKVARQARLLDDLS